MSENIRRDGAFEDSRRDGRTPAPLGRPAPKAPTAPASGTSPHAPAPGAAAGRRTGGARALAPAGLRGAHGPGTAAPGLLSSSPTPHRAARTDASPAPGRSGGTPTAAGHGPYGKEYAMIQQIVHETSDTVDATAPAGLTQALAVAKDLHGPARRSSDAVAFPELMGLRIPAGRPHRYKVPLRRLTAMAA